MAFIFHFIYGLSSFPLHHQPVMVITTCYKWNCTRFFTQFESDHQIISLEDSKQGDVTCASSDRVGMILQVVDVDSARDREVDVFLVTNDGWQIYVEIKDGRMPINKEKVAFFSKNWECVKRSRF